MKITKTQLKQIIKEELEKVTEGNIEEAYRAELEADARALGIAQDIIDEFDDNEELISVIDAVRESGLSPEEVSGMDSSQLFDPRGLVSRYGSLR
tara:strand:+ start:77 stop:361 length:285 start_codon:yes stop_codon:yes gene_type:complete